MAVIAATQNKTLTLGVRQTFTVSTDAVSTGYVLQKSNTLGGNNGTVTQVSASNSITFGPFSEVTTFTVNCNTGTMTISDIAEAVFNTRIGFTSEQLTALAKTPIYSGEAIKNGTSVAVPAGFSTDNGWSIVRFIMGPNDGTSRYLWAACNGSNEIHGQMINSSEKAQGRVVIGGTNKATSDVTFYNLKPGEHMVCGFSWRDDGYEFCSTLSGDSADIYSSKQDFNDQTITMPRTVASALTELRIGSRNAGANPFTGERIEQLEIGNEYLNEQQLYARMKTIANAPIVFVGIGQSLAKGFFTNEVDGLGQAREAFISQLYAQLGYVPCLATIDTAQGATSLLKAHDTGNGYWWDESTGTYGTKGLNMQRQLARLGQVPNFFWHAGHEGDANLIDRAGYSTAAQYEAGLRAFYAKLFADYGAKILISGIGCRTDGYSGAATIGTQKVREIQRRVAADTPYCEFMVETYDATLNGADLIHWDVAACTLIGTRMGKRFASLLGKASNGALGPKIVSATRSTTTVTVTLEHNVGTDFTPTLAIQGFKYLDTNGNNIALSSVNRATATTITMTLASAVAGTLYYIYDAGTDITDLTKVVLDNQAVPMPLQTYKGAVA